MKHRIPGAMGALLSQSPEISKFSKDDQAPVRSDLNLDFSGLGSLDAPDTEKKKAATKRVPTERDTTTKKASDEYLVRMIESEKIYPWSFANRPETEFGDWDDFVSSCVHGIDQPIVVRPSAKNKGQFEVIVGRRRWRACLELGLDVPCFIQSLTDAEAAAKQQRENDKRKDLSVWANAVNWHSLIEKGVFKSQSAMANALQRDRRDISDAMAFMRIDKALYDAIGSLSNVSLAVARLLARLSSDESNIPKLIAVSDRIRDGKITRSQLERICRNVPTNDEPELVKVRGIESHTVRKDSNGTAVISLRKGLLDSVSVLEVSQLIAELHLKRLSERSDKIERGGEDVKSSS